MRIDPGEAGGGLRAAAAVPAARGRLLLRHCARSAGRPRRLRRSLAAGQ